MDENLVKHITKLSNFELNDNELKQYTNDLTNICKILDLVKAYDTKDVKPMISTITDVFKFREDVPEDQDNRSDFDKFACKVVDNYFMVSRVIK